MEKTETENGKNRNWEWEKQKLGKTDSGNRKGRNPVDWSCDLYLLDAAEHGGQDIS